MAKLAAEAPKKDKKAAKAEVPEGKKRKKVEESSGSEEDEPAPVRKSKKAAAAAEAEPAPKKAKSKKEAKETDEEGDKVVKKTKKAAGATAAAAAPAAPIDHTKSTAGDASLAVDNFRLSAPIVAALKAKNIEALFPIQAATLDIVLDGADLVGRARTGQGKTLAFVLPIVEVLAREGGEAAKPGAPAPRLAYGRPPRVIVLLPTRELAKQVFGDFETMGNAFGLSTVCVYGGAPFPPQETALRRGCDVVVGTPGRIKDHLERGNLRLAALRFRVLDEADEMLNMGFVDDVETILNAGGAAGAEGSTFQTLLFSATMPDWVKQISERFLKPNQRVVDLVGSSKLKASASVRHLCLPCHWTQRGQIITDVVRCYGAGGRTIVFCDTKNDANDLAGVLAETVGARALHGDIPQAQREATLAGFRSAKFRVLVATDVAARGLDITGVDLVVQCDPPKDVETYIHRSGRTGRAAATGVCVTLYGRLKEGLLGVIERRAGVSFERVGAPQPAQLAEQAASSAAATVRAVGPRAVAVFRATAATLLAETAAEGVPAADVLAAALAAVAGHKDMKERSLLSAHEDHVTLQYAGPQEVQTPSYVWVLLRRLNLPEEIIGEVKRMTLTADKKGAVFDVPASAADQFVAASAEISRIEALPALVSPPPQSGGFDNRRASFGSNGSGGGRGGYGGGGFRGGRGGGSGGGGFRGGRGRY